MSCTVTRPIAMQNKTMHALQAQFRDIVAEGLRAATTRRIDKWVERYRIILTSDPAHPERPKRPLPYSFDRYPWTREMHMTNAQYCVGMKAAQMGYTEVMLDRSLFANVQLHQDVLYVLPTQQPDAKDFSVMRFDTALELSPYLANLYCDTKNVGLKRTGPNALYVRGSRARNALKSLPVGLIVLDEFEEFDESALPLVLERLSGQDQKQIWMISTPRVPGKGIHAQYLASNQKQFFFRCPCCSKRITLSYPANLVITADDPSSPAISQSHLICDLCKSVLPHAEKPSWLSTGEWVPAYPDRPSEGFHIPQLFSPTIHPADIALSAVKARTNPADEQEFYNSKLGVPHIVANSSVNEADVIAAMRDYVMNDPRVKSQGGITTIGIDVGATCNWVVMNYHFRSTPKSYDINQETFAYLVAAGTFRDFAEADYLMQYYSPVRGVIDHGPETRKAMEFAKRWPGRMTLCHYGNNVKSRDLLDNPDKLMVTVDRTLWIDQALSRFHNKSIFLPKDTPYDFKKHIQALVRIYEKNKIGETVSHYDSAGADHYGHAFTYAEIALRQCAGIGANVNITEPRF